MRTALLTDLHANLESLTALLEECDRRHVDRLVCLGDTVGYGADPNACVDLVRSLADAAVLGNHDAAVAGRMEYDYYYDAARQALDWTAGVLSPENMAWLRALPYAWREGEVAFCHGSPVEPEAYEYVFGLEQARALAPEDGDLPEVTFIGHSHLGRIFAYTKGDVVEVRTDVLDLRKGHRYLISVGSGGQPRDYDPRASLAIYDQEARTVELLRVEYDIVAAARKIVEAGLSPNFARRLFVGM